MLDPSEKHALRQKEKLPFGSGQFPLLGGKKRSPKKRVGGALLWTVVVVAGLIALVAFAIWMQGQP